MFQLRTLEDLSATELDTILYEAGRFAAGEMANETINATVANLFFEPSTRTKVSFEKAEHELGLHIISFDAATSSVTKGETLYDTVKTLEAIGCNAAVIRHPEQKYYEQLEGVTIPVINAGDGAGDHPTQSLLDLLTIQQEFLFFQNLTVVICGDIRHSRVARTNAGILRKLGARVLFSGPAEWMDDTITEGSFVSMDEAVRTADVMMMLRIQTERHDGTADWTKEEYHARYGLTENREAAMKPGAIIMHPAPVNRDVEIADRLVECSRSRIFKQMANGVAVRKAVLTHALKLKEEAK
ncbi:aspartate carbamoyltransferase catalytic subunit [Alteribacter natronophilus]|uniref:aspartate carbamoyltransferase catalytic subunit n=1 Tax=Alteribacter natronophilus TaxID=2583810 RepID=UPI00110DE53A|nr:aspartate carbamoyltransferase catalytic subunit [Alteribacter natronophilus]TMW73147.1 aspartate carbamoyltransferase catalytic subunit [Alteribacter natronophilus]